MSTAEYMAARRQALREALLCVDCKEPTGGPARCADCRKRTADSTSIWRSTERGKRKGAAQARRRRHRAKRKKICCDCKCPVVPGRVRCAAHLATNKVNQQRYLDRKERGERTQSSRVVCVEPVPELKPWQRVLRVVGRFDEVQRADVCEVLGLDEKQADSLSHIFGRLTRKGLVRRLRGGQGSNETTYAITPEGRKAA